MNLLTDVFFFDNLKVIEESRINGTMTVEGTFQRADQPNSNKRIYPKQVLESQVGRLQELIEARRLCGELDHPKNETIKLSNASHLITRLWMEGNEVFGRAELLNTPAGKVAQTLVNDGVSVGISSRGLGTLSEAVSTDGYKTVNDDYKLVTFDLVADPSTKGAFPTLSESVEHFNDTSRLALRERTYVTLIKQELDERFGDKNMNEDNKKGYGMKFKSKKPARATGKINKEGYITAGKVYSGKSILEIFSRNLISFISETEEPELAAQFLTDNKYRILENFINSLDEDAKAMFKKEYRAMRAKASGARVQTPSTPGSGGGGGGRRLHPGVGWTTLGHDRHRGERGSYKIPGSKGDTRRGRRHERRGANVPHTVIGPGEGRGDPHPDQAARAKAAASAVRLKLRDDPPGDTGVTRRQRSAEHTRRVEASPRGVGALERTERGMRRRAKAREHIKSQEPRNDSHDWEVEKNYQMLRLHENMKKFGK